jgi:hypothetical protein
MEAPLLQQRFDETEVSLAKFVTLTEIAPHNGISFAQQGVLLPGHQASRADAQGGRCGQVRRSHVAETSSK